MTCADTVFEESLHKHDANQVDGCTIPGECGRLTSADGSCTFLTSRDEVLRPISALAKTSTATSLANADAPGCLLQMVASQRFGGWSFCQSTGVARDAIVIGTRSRFLEDGTARSLSIT